MLESPLLLSNNTEFSLHMAKHWDKITEVDRPVPTESLKDEDKFQVFPNSVFKVPLVWIIEDYSLLYLTHRNNRGQYMLMFSELQNKVWGEKRTDADGKPVFDFETGIKFLQSDGRDEIHVSADLSVFKCKPTTLDLPP